MNITILANQDIASNFALNLLLPHLQQHKVTVFLSAKVGGNTDKPAALNDLKECEQVYALALISKCSGDKFKNFEQLSQFCQAPITQLNRINHPSELKLLANTQADLIISIRYGVILKDAAIACAKHGVINLHSGILPNYRGVMASFWALLNKDSNLGTTLHYIADSTIDTGNVIATTQLNVNPSKSYLWHVLHLYIQGTQKIITCVNNYHLNRPTATVIQPPSDDYYTFPNRANLEKFFNSGFLLFDKNELTQLIASYY